MKNMYKLALAAVMMQAQVSAQIKWDGGGGDNQWNNAANWTSDQVPAPSDDVIIDNEWMTGNFSVLLPAGAITVTVNSIHILPSSGGTIELTLPKENTIAPGLVITGASIGLLAGSGAIVRNASGASSGDAIAISSGFKILNGGRYIHKTPRGNAAIINQLVNDTGTEKGIFEFDVPGTAGYTVSLTGNTFGTLIFSASNGTKSYSGNGSSTLTINGDLIVKQGATITSTLTANITIGGNLEVNGTINFNPPSAGLSNRSVLLSGNPCVIKGNGNIQMNANFNRLTLLAQAKCKLERSLTLSNSGNTFHVGSDAVLETGMHSISGNGSFIIDDNAGIHFGAAVGIQQLFQSGNICTASRSLSSNASYYFNGAGVQSTGNSFPAAVKNLFLNKNDGQLVLNQDLTVNGKLSLESGIILTDANAKLLLKDAEIVSPVSQYNLSNTGWEKSYISGPVYAELNNPGKYFVPIGKGNHFAPIMLEKISGGQSTFSIEYFPSQFSNFFPVQNATLHHISQLEYWEINALNNNSNDEVNIGLSWRPYSAVANSPDERNALRVAFLDETEQGFRWQRLGSDPEIDGNNEFGFISSKQSAIPDGPFSLASAAVVNILPFRSIDVEAKENSKGITVNWIVDAEDDLEYFVIEKSRDGISFQPIDSVKTDIRYNDRKYSITDKLPFYGINVYRIVVKTKHSTSFYSSIVRAKYSGKGEIKLYPNPAVKEIFIFFPHLSSRTECRIVRYNGSEVVKRVFINENNYRINIDDLPSGQYFVLLFIENGLVALPFLKY